MRQRAEHFNKDQTKFYIPGKSPGQPFKHDYYRMCYNITKTMRKANNPLGDKFDYFLSEADQKINYWESAWRTTNPYNPYRLTAEFNITVIDEAPFQQIRDKMSKTFGLKLDDMLVVEGCLNDDKTVLGGRNEFLSHFCTFFKFNICFSAAESKGVRALDKKLSNPDTMDAFL